MTQYYYASGKEQLGPFTLDELKTKGITRDTLVWHDSLKDWIEAGRLEELSELFKSVPPPLVEKKLPPPVNQDKKKKNRTGLVITVILLVGAIITFVAFYKDIFPNKNSSNSTQTDSEQQDQTQYSNNNVTDTYVPPKEKTEAELRNELYEKEKVNPTEYLTVSYDIVFDLFQGDLVKGTIYNSATIATFKDVQLTVVYYTSTSTELKRENKTVYEYIGPNSSQNFKLEIKAPRDCKKVGVEIKTASPE